MNATLNYFLEANVSIVIIYVLYLLALRKATNFSLLRFILLSAIAASLLIPLVQSPLLTNGAGMAGDVIPTYWLGSVEAGGKNAETGVSWHGYVTAAIWIYAAGFMFFGFRLARALWQIFSIIRSGDRLPGGKNLTLFTGKTPGTFSFFHYVFIGNFDDFTESDRTYIVNHEAIHSARLHSADILFLELLAVVFWFNPAVNRLKKIFAEIHEFEADSQVARSTDVNGYCALLARVALQSSGFSFASHFNNSLTIKRITMLRNFTNPVGRKGIAAFTIVSLLWFVFVACQDQVGADEPYSAESAPEAALSRFATFKENYKGETFLVENNGDAGKVISDLETKYGKPAHVEIFTIEVKGKPVAFSMMHFSTGAPTASDDVMVVVQEQPEYIGGYDAMVRFIANNLVYPTTARMKGVEGTVFVQFIVETDGNVSSVQTIRGFDRECDAAAEQVVQKLKWKPGRHDGKSVRVRFVIPIVFRLN